MVQETGTLRNEAGVQLKRNTAVVKKYHGQIALANGNGDQVVQGITVEADESGQSRVSETKKVSGPSKKPVTSGVSESSQVQAGNCTEKEDNEVGRPAKVELDYKTACSL